MSLAMRRTPPRGSVERASGGSPILLVDDHPPNLLALEAVLSSLGETCQRAYSGAEALRQLELNDFAVVLLDVQMPGLSGFEVAARLRRQGLQTPIIFLTAGQEDDALRSLGYDSGAVDFMVKPFEPSVLRAKVRTFVELHRQRRELERLSALYDAERVAALRRLQTLATISAQLSRWLTQAEVVQLIGEAQRAVGASLRCVYLRAAGVEPSLDPEAPAERPLELARGAEAASLEPFSPAAAAPAAAAVSSAAPVWVSDRATLLRAFPGFESEARVEALCAVPLGVGREPSGVLVFGFEAARRWDSAEQEFLVALAVQFGGALERARLVETEREARRLLEKQTHAMRLMADVGTLLSSSLDHRAVLRRLTELLVPAVADWCAVDVLDPSGRIVRVSAYHADPAKLALALELEKRYPVDPDAPRGVPNVLRTGRAEWMAEIHDALLEAAARDAEHLETIRQLGLRSYVTVPIKARGRVLGALSVIYAESGRTYTAADVSYVEELAARAGLSVDNALLFQEAEQLIAQLDKSNKDLDQFAYVASHDLKAPLRGIANLSQWLEEDLGDAVTDSARQQLDLLRNRVQRMEGLINGILDYSRAGRVRSKLELVSIERLLGEVVELSAAPAGAVFKIAEGMPTLRTERVPLQQVFMNLIGNALKHCKRSEPEVVVGVADAGELFEFSVSDNGAGIAPEFHERIWVIFQTLEPRDVVEGTGIGLSVVRKIVENKGGRAWVESREGSGATFRFTWPKAEREAQNSV